jgi:transposase
MKLELGKSWLELDTEGITIHIARQHFTPGQWLRLCEQIAQAAANLVWLRLPFQATQVEDGEHPEAGTPRWKIITLDVFSFLIYLLVIPAGHKLVQLIQVIDWLEIDRRCADCYENAKHGARAYAPQVLFRLLLLLFLYNLAFESELIQQTQTQIVWRWFCGLSLLVPMPTASTLCHFRKRLGVERFEKILIWLLQQCEAVGLVGHLEAYFDFTAVEACATPLTPYQRTVVMAKALSAYLAGIEEKSVDAKAPLTPILRQLVMEVAQEVMAEQHPSVKKLQPEQLLRSQERMDERIAQQPQGPRWWVRLCQVIGSLKGDKGEDRADVQAAWQQVDALPIEAAEREPILTTLRTHLRQIAHQLLGYIPHAWGDLDARVGQASRTEQVCGYLRGFLVDSKHNIITAVVSVAANVAQAPQVTVALNKCKAALGRLPPHLGLDSAFDQDEVHRNLKGLGVKATISSRNHRAPKGGLGAEHFPVDEKGNVCCPVKKPMKVKYGPYADGTTVYEGTACAGCPRCGECMPEGKETRQLRVNPDKHQRWLANREHSQSEEGRKTLGQRFASEGVFGHTNTYHNGDRAPYRSDEMNTIAAYMSAFASNLEKLALHGNASAS